MRLTKNQKNVLRNVARNTPFSKPNNVTLKSLEKKGLIRKIESSITFWALTDSGETLYRKVFNIAPENW